MLTVKLMKYSKPTYNGSTDGKITRDPGYTESVVVHPADAVFVEYACIREYGRHIVGVKNPKNGEIEQFTIGDAERDDVMFNCVYIMNDAGRTVETIRG